MSHNISVNFNLQQDIITQPHHQYTDLTAHHLPHCHCHNSVSVTIGGADKSLARPVLFDGENISFDASLVICIKSTNIPSIMIINRIYEHQILLSL